MSDFSEWPRAAKALAGVFAVLLVAVLWSVFASVVFLAGTGLLPKHEGFPLADWWLYWWFYGWDKPVVGVWLKIAAGIATGFPLLAVVAGLLRKGARGPTNALHGKTGWAQNRDLATEFRAKFGGLFVGYTGSRDYLRFEGPEHVACYAPTRSGKGVGLVIPNCLLYDGSLVCLDMKKQNFAATAGIRKQMGQRVFLFDPLAPDGRTARYNPLTYVRRGTLDAFDDIQRIAQMIFPEPGGSDGSSAFFTESARSAFTGATALLAETPELPLNIGQVLRLLTRADGPTYIMGLIEARRTAGNPYTAATVGALEDYLKGSADTVGDIRKTMTAKLSLWFNPRIDAATSESDFDLRELRNSLHAIYVGVTPDNIKRLRPLLALFFQQLIDLNVRTLPQFDPRAKYQVLLNLDEFASLGPMPVLADAFAFVAEYGIRMLLIMQSKSQIKNPDLYGPDKATEILDNCGVEVVFGTKNNDIAKELSERLGTDTVEGLSQSGPRFWRMFKGTKLNETVSDQARPLLLPQEIIRLKRHECIIIRPGMLPIKAKRIRYFKDRTFTRLLRKAPEIPAIEVVQRMDAGNQTPVAAAPASASKAAAAPAAKVAPAVASTPASTEGGKVKPTKAKPKAKLAAEATDASAEATASTPVAEAPAMRSFQADGLIAGVMGVDVDLGKYAMKDGKAKFAAILDRLPTPEAQTRGRRTAA